MQKTVDFSDFWDSLTHVQKLVSQLLVEGMTDKEIACELNISQRTASSHVYAILKKFKPVGYKVSNRKRLISFCLKNNVYCKKGEKS